MWVCPDCGVLNGKVLLAWENGSVQITFRPESRSTFRVKAYLEVCIRWSGLDSTKCKAVGQAGGVLLTTTVGLAGIDRLLSTALSRWRKPSAVHVACSETDGPRTLADNHGPGPAHSYT